MALDHDRVGARSTRTASNEETVRRYWQAAEKADFDTIEGLVHDDYRVTYPQSGERIVGIANNRAIHERYPGGLPTANDHRTHGDADRYVMTPALTVQRIGGSGEFWVGEATLTYANGETWRYVSLVELRDGLVWRETEYFAPPFDPPAWRAPWTERSR